jgi:NADH dehydrogenase FAD-containing subunit
MNRRQFQKLFWQGAGPSVLAANWGLGANLGAGVGVGLGWGSLPQNARAASSARVVIVGAGFGGATLAKYLRILSKQSIQVTLIESQKSFISSPMSNLVLGANATLEQIEFSYDALRKRHGIRWIEDRASEIDFNKKMIHCLHHKNIAYDKLILAPGMKMLLEDIEGLEEAKARQQIFQAWGPEREIPLLQAQIAGMQNGQTFVLGIPESPFKCPPGPYERASQVASYFKKHKPQCKVLILDANQDVLSNSASFKRFWAQHYPTIIDYRPQHMVTSVDANRKTIGFEIQDDVSYDVANILPPMRAGDIAHQNGLTNINNKWCGVDFSNFESQKAKDVHLLGDAIQGAPLMPKSAHMANSQAKILASILVAELYDLSPDPAAFLTNTCYSFLDDQNAVHIASVHQYDKVEKTYKVIPQSSGVSLQPSELEGVQAHAWAKHIWADTLS